MTLLDYVNQILIEEKMNKERYPEEFIEYHKKQCEMVTYMEEETNSKKDYKFEHEYDSNWIPF